MGSVQDDRKVVFGGPVTAALFENFAGQRLTLRDRRD